MGQRLCTRLDLLTPSVEKHVEARQHSTMLRRTAHRGLRQFNAGDTVLVRNYGMYKAFCYSYPDCIGCKIMGKIQMLQHTSSFLILKLLPVT